MRQVQAWMDVVSSFDQGSGMIVDPRIIQALELLQSIDPNTLDEWLITLAQAIRSGEFDEVYNQLLQQGMNKLRQAILLLLNSSNSEDAEQIIHQTASAILASESREFPPRVEVWIKVIRNLIKGFLMSFNQPGWPEEAAEAEADKFADQLRAALRVLPEGLLNLLCGQFPCSPFGPPDGIDWFLSVVLTAILTNVWQNNSPLTFDPVFFHGPALSCSQACQVTRQLGAFLEWIAQAKGMSDSERDIRLFVGFGTLMAAYNAIQASDSWQIKGWLGPNGQPLQPGDSHAFLVEKGKLSDGRSVVAVVRGDACKKCGTEANIKDITSWVEKALDVIFTKKPDKFRLNADQGVIVLAFTRNNPRGMDKVIEALQDEFSGSDVPIIIAWKVGNTVYYKCIGDCDGLSEEDQKRIACEHVGGSCDNVQEYNEGNPSSSNPSPDQSPSGEDPITACPPPPLNPDGSPCTDPPCIESEPSLPIGS